MNSIFGTKRPIILVDGTFVHYRGEALGIEGSTPVTYKYGYAMTARTHLTLRYTDLFGRDQRIDAVRVTKGQQRRSGRMVLRVDTAQSS